MVRWTVEELIGRPSHDLLHHSRPDGIGYPREACPFHKALATGAVHHVKDEVFWRKNGTSFPIEYVSTPITEGGNITGAVVVFRDISGRKQTEEALKEAVLKAREEKARTEAIVSAIGDSLVVVDPHFRIIYQNRLTGISWEASSAKFNYKTFEGRRQFEDCPVEISFKDGWSTGAKEWR
jgi:PAS domain S-box-containing protein